VKSSHRLNAILLQESPGRGRQEKKSRSLGALLKKNDKRKSLITERPHEERGREILCPRIVRAISSWIWFVKIKRRKSIIGKNLLLFKGDRVSWAT